MMKHMIMFIPLCACAPHPNNIPPPTKQIVVTKEVPVPVLCKVIVTKPALGIDQANPNVPLEQQNATLRETIAEQETYIIDLVAAVVGCGGKVQ